ncbi:hypothetical protein [Klebsiella variicola]|uniref:hypothetical protein n=1 Tax=Klebsiella TaxID=570 RepID=UPI001CB724BF|nr:hypothetical protein [Klebsiella variicola]
MMYQRTDLTLSMFYASSADADGNKVATLTMQVIAAEAGAVQTSQLRCITDSAKKKTYSVGEQSVSNGSDPLLVAIENYWRQSTDGRARPCAKNQQYRRDTGRRFRNVCSGSVWYRQC